MYDLTSAGVVTLKARRVSINASIVDSLVIAALVVNFEIGRSIDKSVTNGQRILPIVTEHWFISLFLSRTQDARHGVLKPTQTAFNSFTLCNDAYSGREHGQFDFYSWILLLEKVSICLMTTRAGVEVQSMPRIYAKLEAFLFLRRWSDTKYTSAILL